MTWTKDSLHHWSNQIQVYRCIQIITIEFNDCLSYTCWPIFQAYILSVQVLSIYVCVKLHDVVHFSFVTAFAGVTFLCFVYDLSTYGTVGRVYNSSTEFLRRTRGSRNKEWSRVRKSIPATGVSVGGCYTISLMTVLTFVSFALNVTTNFLVST